MTVRSENQLSEPTELEIDFIVQNLSNRVNEQRYIAEPKREARKVERGR